MKKTKSVPKKLDDFIGKEKIKNALKIYISESIKLDKQLENIVIFGKNGVGKKTLAKIIANELNVKMLYFYGSKIHMINDILKYISKINDKNIIFIDDIDKVDSQTLKLLSRIIKNLDSSKFTFICSTTNISKLSKSFLSSFEIYFYLDPYEENEIVQILKKNTSEFLFNITDYDLNLIARSCNGIPKVAIDLLNHYYKNKITLI